MRAKPEGHTQIVRDFKAQAMRVRQTARRNGTILVVEDDDAYAYFLRDLLNLHQRKHERVDSVEGVKQFMAVHESHELRCILLDLRLKEGNGLVLLAWLHENHSEIPILIHSGAPAVELDMIRERHPEVRVVPKTGRVADLVHHLGLDLTRVGHAV